MAALTIAMVFTACSDSAPPPAAPAPDAAAPVDDAPVEADEGRAIPDSGPAQQDDGVVVDTGPVEPPSPCEARCAAFVECGEAVMAACERTCDDEEVATCEDACLEKDNSCASAEQCLGVIADGGEPWNDGPFGQGWRDVADEFVLPTLRGDWSFAAEWTGHDSHVFAITQTGFEPAQQLWASEPFYWLDESPQNVHYFFMAYTNAAGEDDSAALVSKMKEQLDPVLTKLGVIRGRALECHWRRRIHYVTTSAWSLSNWMSAKLQGTPVMSFAIDRFQRLRPVGLLSLVQSTPILKHLQYPAAYYNFELMREKEAWKGAQTTVTMYDQEKVNGADVMVDLPSKEELATFDTLEIDLSQYCDQHSDQSCFEWDYKAFINVRERPVEDENADAEKPCQGEVKAVEAAEEVPGTCPDESTCTADIDCGDDAVCEGYQPEVLPVEAVAADTLPCKCHVPGQADPRDADKVCKGDGTGFNACQCNEQWEIARWITTYHREGRWVMDASAFLPLLDAGGKTRFKFKGSYPYTTTVHLNFSNRGKPHRARTVQKIFTGGGFGPGYGSNKEPKDVTIPDATKHAEIFAFITGHGFGGMPHNCAEFCNHTHHFTIDGTEFAHSHKYINDYYGCAKQVSEGTVPNQYGTWTIGRGGWCPGKDVTPFVADITAVTSPTTTISYIGMLDGKPHKEGDPGYGGSIWMSSYVITYD